jgi:hypothetical protein
MPPVGFEPTIAVLERAKTVRALDRAATAIGMTNYSLTVHYGDSTRPQQATGTSSNIRQMSTGDADLLVIDTASSRSNK